MKDAYFSSYGLHRQGGIRFVFGDPRWQGWKKVLDYIKSWSLVLIPLGFLLGRSNLIGEIAPFGAVFWLLLLRERPGESYAVAAAVLLGCATAHGGSPAILLLASMFLVWFWEALCLKLWGKRSPLLLSTFLLVITGNFALFITPGISYTGALVLSGKVAVGVLAAYALSPAVSLTKKMPFIRDRPVNFGEAISVILVFSLALLGLREIQAGGFYLVNFIAKLIMLLVAYNAGASRGAAAGVITGTILGLGNPHMYMSIGSLSFSGFWAGFMSRFGRLASVLGVLAAAPFLALLGSSELPVVGSLENLVVAGIFLLIPPGWMTKLRELFVVVNTGTESFIHPQKYLSYKAEQLSEVFQELAASFTGEEDSKDKTKEEITAEFVNELKERTCYTCMLQRKCWSEELYRNARAVMELVSCQEERVKEEELPAEIQKRCPSPNKLVENINRCRELWQTENYWSERLKEGRELVTRQLDGMARFMQDLNRELETQPLPLSRSGARPPNLSIEVGMSQYPGRNERVCGDYYVFTEIDENRQAVIISDGMGTGPQARQESRSTVILIEKMLKAGFSTEMIVRSLNSLWQLKDTEEVFATLDLVLINLENSEVEWVKAGAAPSYFKRRQEVQKIGASSLPPGILNELDVECSTCTIKAEDILVMVSDGVTAPAGDWIPAFLSQYEQKHPQVIADRLMEEALRRNGNNDDKTVVACRLVPLKEQGGE